MVKEMSHIDIQARHNLSHNDAVAAADALCVELAEKFGFDYGWDDNTIHFERSGVNGSISVLENRIDVQAKLGFMLMMMKDPIEKEIMGHLQTHFGCEPDSF